MDIFLHSTLIVLECNVECKKEVVHCTLKKRGDPRKFGKRVKEKQVAKLYHTDV